MNNGIQLDKVSFSYKSDTPQLKDINLQIPKGTFLVSPVLMVQEKQPLAYY